MKRPPRQRQRQQVDTAVILHQASGRWLDILATAGGIPADVLDGKHHPCPRCGGRDRFRLIDADAGAVICNQCGRSNGDGIASIRWATGMDFRAACEAICRHMGIDLPVIGGSGVEASSGGDHPHQLATSQLRFLPWSDYMVSLWARHKPPITPAAVRAVGGQLARYLDRYTVVALPVWGERLTVAEPVGWVLYNTTGGTLPVFQQGEPDPVSWVKVKTLSGSCRGWIGNVAALEAATTVWKLEGPSDVLGLLSLPDLPSNAVALTNVHGAKEDPAKCRHLLNVLHGKTTYVCHDADRPGQDGAIGWQEAGRRRPGWCEAVATTAAECRHVRLPCPVSADHGRDLRDWIGDGHGYGDLLELAAEAAIVQPPADGLGLRAIEAADDPHRLARLNLERYATHQGGRTLRYWRSEWYVWCGTHYRQIPDEELRAKVSHAIKQEFDRLNIAEQESGDVGEDGPKPTRKVTSALVTNVLQATASLPGVTIQRYVERMTWLPDRNRRRYIAMQNGLIDIDAVLSDRPEEECILPHSPDWFSTICLPYKFDKDAMCPLWEAFLERNLEGDQERIDLLQEWAGYLLTPDTGQQKFLYLEGEGANGKGVYAAGITGMLGMENCSFVPLETFGDRFSKTTTLGRLVNISGDAAELDKVAEGYIKSFTSGDPMHFDRKGISGIEAIPTARLMIAANNRPRFSDRSEGIWRRMIPVPWDVQIHRKERVVGMDKHEWWQQQGELPGIFLWALRGLARLHIQGDFTHSSAVENTLQDYRSEMNPARMFLDEFVEPATSGQIRSNHLYDFYKRWTAENGYRNLSSKQFFKEVKRRFKNCERLRGGTRSDRFWFYNGIQFSQDEICGESTNDSTLF